MKDGRKLSKLASSVSASVKNSKLMQKPIYSMPCTETLWPEKGLKSSLKIIDATKFVVVIRKTFDGI